MSKIALFQTIQFSISTHLSSISLIDRTLSGATTLGQSGPGSDGNERVHSITGASLSDCLMTYPRHSLWEVPPLCRDAAPGDWVGATSPQRSKTPLMSILDMTLNNLIVRFQ